MNFNNSAICGIIEITFLRTKKERFIYTMYTTTKRTSLIINIIQNNKNEFSRLLIKLPIIRNRFNALKRSTRLRVNKLIGQLIIGLGTVVVNWNQFNTAPRKY